MNLRILDGTREIEYPPNTSPYDAARLTPVLHRLGEAGCPVNQNARHSLSRLFATSLVKAAGGQTEGMESTDFESLGAAALAWCGVWQHPDCQPTDPGQALMRCLNPHGQTFMKNIRHTVCLNYGCDDFPYILADTAERILVQAATAEPPSWRKWGRVVPLKFLDRPATLAWMSPLGPLPRVPEGSEYKLTAALQDNGVEMPACKYGATWRISLEAFVRDDLRALSNPAEVHGSAARDLQDDLVYTHLTDNPVMADGKQLFCADHANLMVGSALDDTNLALARSALAAQSAPNGVALRLAARFLLVPVALAGDASTMLRAMGNYDLPPDEQIILVVEPRLDLDSTTAWYLACNPMRWPTLECGFLGSDPVPLMSSEWSSRYEALQCKVRLFFGRAIVDFRGLVKNPGV